jgi:hypothetical protein
MAEARRESRALSPLFKFHFRLASSRHSRRVDPVGVVEPLRRRDRVGLGAISANRTWNTPSFNEPTCMNLTVCWVLGMPAGKDWSRAAFLRSTASRSGWLTKVRFGTVSGRKSRPPALPGCAKSGGARAAPRASGLPRIADELLHRGSRQLRARTGHSGNSLDHLVGPRLKHGWYAKPECFGGFQVDDHFKDCRLDYREVGRFLPFEDASCIATDFAIGSS